MAVASARPYASLTSLQTDNHASTPPLSSQQTSPGVARQGTATSHALHITPGKACQGAAPGHTLGITPEGTSGHSRSRLANKSWKSTPGRRTRSHSRHNSVESTSGRRSRSRSANKSRKNASRCSSRSQPRNKSSASVEGASGRSRATAALASTHLSGYFFCFHIFLFWNSTVRCYSQ